MAVIGIELDTDTLVLTRGRDFRWSFDNLDTDGKTPIDYPAGELFFELVTGGEHNAMQEVRVTGASGGVYRFEFDGETTGDIDYYDATENPHGLDGDVTDALEALPNIGPGNVKVHPAQLFPVWQIDLTLNAGKNEIQQISFTGNPTGGNFKLGYAGQVTSAIDFGAPAADVETALEALSTIGTGNVRVTPVQGGGYQVEFIGALAEQNVQQILAYSSGIDLSLPTWFFGLTGGFFPSVKVSTVADGSAKFTEKLVNTLNKTINDLFNSFDAMLGVDIDYVVHDNLNTTLKVTSLRAFTESDLITFSVDVTSTMVENFLNSVSTFVGMFDTIHVDFFWNHVYKVEFIGELGNRPQPALVPDISDLEGLNDQQNVEVTVLAPGKERLTKWPFVIDGATASLKVESEDADKIPARTHWQLVFLPEGEAAGGDPIARGRVAVQE